MKAKPIGATQGRKAVPLLLLFSIWVGSLADDAIREEASVESSDNSHRLELKGNRFAITHDGSVVAEGEVGGRGPSWYEPVLSDDGRHFALVDNRDGIGFYDLAGRQTGYVDGDDLLRQAMQAPVRLPADTATTFETGWADYDCVLEQSGDTLVVRVGAAGRAELSLSEARVIEVQKGIGRSVGLWAFLIGFWPLTVLGGVAMVALGVLIRGWVLGRRLNN